MEEPVRLDKVPGLTDALDAFVGSPIPIELLRRFAARSDFDLGGYPHHILAHIESAFIDRPGIEYPLLALVVSGGHTTLFSQRGKFSAEAVAKTLHIPDAQKNLVAQAQEGNFDGDRSSVSEMDALIAYLQVLGTMVDFSKIKPEELVKFR